MSPVDQAVIDLVTGAAVWVVPGFEVDSFVHEIRALDRHLSASSKVDQSEAVFVCIVMQAVSPNSRLVYGLPSDFCVRVPHHQLHVVFWASGICSLQLFIKLVLSLLFRIVRWCMYVDEGVVEESAFYSQYAETLIDRGEIFNQMVKVRIHEESRSKFVFVCLAASIDVILATHEGPWGQFSSPSFLDCGYCDLILP